MKKKNIIILLLNVFLSGCLNTNNDDIRVHVTQDLKTSQNGKLSFIVKIYTTNKKKIALNIHKSLKDTLRIGDWLNKCTKPSFFLMKRKSDFTAVYASKDNPYILNISADYWFDASNDMHVLDFGELGKICRDRQNETIKLFFKFYEANISNFEALFSDKDNGVLSNQIEINYK